MPRPPCCTRMFLVLLAQKLAGEDELQNRHGKRYHS